MASPHPITASYRDSNEYFHQILPWAGFFPDSYAGLRSLLGWVGVCSMQHEFYNALYYPVTPPVLEPAVSHQSTTSSQQALPPPPAAVAVVAGGAAAAEEALPAALLPAAGTKISSSLVCVALGSMALWLPLGIVLGARLGHVSRSQN